KIKINDEFYEATSIGDGQFDAFMKALKSIYKKINKEIPKLIDYAVSIPSGGKTDAIVEAIITWEFKNKKFSTRGIDCDQTTAAIFATQRMLNLIENKQFFEH
ncbi:MAG: 2-isopropylmalate synthase, partial [Candidatus Moranbacteria bacterium]|nr:2-isopropylmalate synthase [Candidatus Moranbacteria bacterium]